MRKNDGQTLIQTGRQRVEICFSAGNISRTKLNSDGSHILKTNANPPPECQSLSYARIPTGDVDSLSIRQSFTDSRGNDVESEIVLDGRLESSLEDDGSGTCVTKFHGIGQRNAENQKDGINSSYNSSDHSDHISNDNGGHGNGEKGFGAIEFEEDSEKSQFKDRYGPQFFAALAATMGAFGLGSVLSWTSPALPDLRERKTIGEINGTEESWISSIALLGAAASCPIIGMVMERFGRRKCMLLLTTPFVLGWLLITFAQNIWMMYAGRFLTGFCGGGCSIAVPVYITETASVKIRGMLGSGFDMLITVGILYIFIVGTYVNWQYQAVACGLIPIVFHLLMMFSPESPRYLVERGRHADANKALCWLRGAKSSRQIQPEMDELVKSVDESRNKPASWRDLIQDKSVLKPTLIAIILMIFQQLSAIDAVMFYTVDIFRTAGTDIDENLSANIVGAVQVLATITAAVLVDHSGRRFLLLVSEIGMVISLAAMGTFFYLKEKNNDEVPEHLGWLPLASLMVFCIAFSVGMGPLPWLLMGELLPPNVKGLASGLVTITRWILGFVVTIVFKGIMENLGLHGGYWLFSGCCCVGTIFVYFFVPETKGKTLDEIQQFFQPSQIDTNYKKRSIPNLDNSPAKINTNSA